MSEDLVSIATAAVAAAKDIPADIDAAEAAGEVVGTQEPDDIGLDDGAPASKTAAAVVDAEGVDPSAAVEKPADKPAEPADGDDFDAVPERDSTGRFNRIPHPRVKVMVDKAVSKALAPVQQEVTTLREHNSLYTSRLQNIETFESLLVNDPDKAVEVLARINPRFGELFKTGAVETPVAPATTELDFSKAPPPDSPDGYTNAGLQKLLAWTATESAAIATAKAVAEAEARIGKRYAPIEQTFQQQRAQHEANTRLAQFTNATLEDARQWKHFNDHEGDILKALQEDSAQAAKPGGKLKYNGRTAVRQAYEDVVFGKITTDRQKVRESIMAELEKAPRSTASASSRAGAATPAEPDGPVNNLTQLEDIAKAAIRQHTGR